MVLSCSRFGYGCWLQRRISPSSWHCLLLRLPSTDVATEDRIRWGFSPGWTPLCPPGWILLNLHPDRESPLVLESLFDMTRKEMDAVSFLLAWQKIPPPPNFLVVPHTALWGPNASSHPQEMRLVDVSEHCRLPCRGGDRTECSGTVKHLSRGAKNLLSSLFYWS